MTRRTQTERYANRLYAAATYAPRILGMILEVRPPAFLHEAGDVIRVISQRLAFDGYLRIVSCDWTADDYFVRLECKQYVHQIYVAAPFMSAVIVAPKVKAKRAIPQLAASARRVA